MEIINLKYPYSFREKDDPNAVAFVEQINRIRKLIPEGRVYARFVEGDRKGSICKIEFKYPDSKHSLVESCIRPHGTFHNNWYNVENSHISAVGKWTGKSHKPEVRIPSKDVELLIDYDGPTIWRKFDAKSAKEEILKNPDQRDIDDNVINIGDRVLYINARYGSGMELERGTVQEFKVSVNANTHKISTVIKSDAGEISTLNYPETMVFKINS